MIQCQENKWQLGKKSLDMEISGIYKITNKLNGKFYIGSASNIKRRWRQHRFDLIHNTHDNIHLQRSWNKYGQEEFLFELVEECDKGSLVLREQFYMDTLNPQYNIGKFATSSVGIKRSQETIEKHRQKMLGRKLTTEHKEKVRLSSLGRKHSPETRLKQRLVKLGKKISEETRARMCKAKSNMSEETKRKISQALLGKKRTPEAEAKRIATLKYNIQMRKNNEKS